MKSFLEESFDDNNEKPIILNDRLLSKTQSIFDILNVSHLWDGYVSSVVSVERDAVVESLIKR